MAKITANGAKEVTRWSASIDGHEVGQILLRSDGRILRKTFQATGWTLASKVKPGRPEAHMIEVVEAHYERRGYTLRRA